METGHFVSPKSHKNRRGLSCRLIPRSKAIVICKVMLSVGRFLYITRGLASLNVGPVEGDLLSRFSITFSASLYVPFNAPLGGRVRRFL